MAWSACPAPPEKINAVVSGAMRVVSGVFSPLPEARAPFLIPAESEFCSLNRPCLGPFESCRSVMLQEMMYREDISFDDLLQLASDMGEGSCDQLPTGRARLLTGTCHDTCPLLTPSFAAVRDVPTP